MASSQGKLPVTSLREGHLGYTRGFVPRLVPLDLRESDAELRESNVTGPILQGLAARSEGRSVLGTIEILFQRARAAELRESGLREELGRISRDPADETFVSGPLEHGCREAARLSRSGLHNAL